MEDAEDGGELAVAMLDMWDKEGVVSTALEEEDIEVAVRVERGSGTVDSIEAELREGDPG